MVDFPEFPGRVLTNPCAIASHRDFCSSLLRYERPRSISFLSPLRSLPPPWQGSSDQSACFLFMEFNTNLKNFISIDIATRGAEQFVELYYPAYDSEDRVESLPKFYRPSSSIVWNGNPIQGNEGVKRLIETMPRSKHEIQLHDCHPVPSEP